MLTPRQEQILDFLKSHIRDKGFPPTRAEIQLHFGYHSVNAAEDHLRALQRRGAIQLIRGASRGIRLLEPKQQPTLPADSQWEEVCRDAERYRWLRTVRPDWSAYVELWAVHTEQEFDAMLDSLRGTQHEETAPEDSESPLPG